MLEGNGLETHRYANPVYVRTYERCEQSVQNVRKACGAGRAAAALHPQTTVPHAHPL